MRETPFMERDYQDRMMIAGGGGRDGGRKGDRDRAERDRDRGDRDRDRDHDRRRGGEREKDKDIKDKDRFIANWIKVNGTWVKFPVPHELAYPATAASRPAGFW